MQRRGDEVMRAGSASYIHQSRGRGSLGQRLHHLLIGGKSRCWTIVKGVALQ